MPSSEELAFLARIRERPDDDGPRLIFADWLDEHGDPRGEFIRVQCAIHRLPATDPRREELDEREKDLLKKHSRRWTAKLQGLATGWTYCRGLIESISVDASAFVERGLEIFTSGPIRRVRFVEANQCFAALVDSPHLSRVREIDLCDNSLGNGGVNQLARSKHLENLEYLNLGFNDITDQGLKTLAAMPQLSQLRELYLNDNRQIGTPGLRALADSASFGNLRHLDLTGNLQSESAMKVLINGESLQKLDSLALAGNNIGDEGVAALVQSELVKRMLARAPVLNLQHNRIGPIGARALAESPYLAPLEELNLDSNDISDAGLRSLAQSPYLRLKRLIVPHNRINDEGLRALANSGWLGTLEFLDLEGNLYTSAGVGRIDNAARDISFEKKIEIKQDPGLHLRAVAR